MKTHFRSINFFVLLLVAFCVFMVITISSEYDQLGQFETKINLEEAQTLKTFVRSFRWVYLQAFLENNIAFNEKTIHLLPAVSITAISEEFAKHTGGKATVSTVSDRPRNPKNLVDDLEAEAMAYFRKYPDSDEYIREVKEDSGRVFFYAAPMYIKKFCLQCHGEKSTSLPLVAEKYDTAFGYEEGDLRGVISIKLNRPEIREDLFNNFFIKSTLYTSLSGLLFLVVIFYLLMMMKKRENSYMGTLELEVDKQTAELVEQLQLLELNANIGLALTKGQSLTDILSQCATIMVKHLDAAFVRIWLVDDDKSCLVLKASAGLYTHLDSKHSRKAIAPDTKIGNIAFTRKPYLSNQLLGDPQILDQEWVKRKGMASFAGHPLLIDGTVLGVLAMFSRHELSSVTQDTLKGVAGQIALGVQRIVSESTLVASEAKFRDLIEDTVDWIWELNSQGVYTYSSPQVTEFIGYSPEEVLGKTPFDLMPAEEVERVGKIFQGIVARREVFHDLENSNIHKNGSTVVLETSGRPIFDSKGTFCGYRGIDREITQRKKSEKVLRQQREQLQQAQKMEAIGTLAGGIAHDFNNILTAIIGYSQLAQIDRDNHEKLERDIHEILLGADRAKNLVQQILTFGRKTRQEKQALQISLVVKEALKLLRSSIPTTIEIRQEILSNSLVLADPTNIHQIVMNLCTNAYHAMRESGGTIDVTLNDVEISGGDTALQLGLPDGLYVRLTVNDTGKGMDVETQEKIFDPYFTTKKIGEGTGLGLAVVHGIVKELEGGVKIFSEVDQGSSFNIYLPLHQEQEAVTVSQTHETTSVVGDESILFIDDDVKIIDFAKRALTEHGYDVYAYSNGVQALQDFQQHPLKFDLVITDMTMPYMTGTQLSQKILEVNPNIPIILCTGHSELTNREKSLAMGIKEYVEKPLDIDRLLRTVREVVDASKGDGQ